MSQIPDPRSEGVLVQLPDGTVTFLLTDIEGSTARWESRPTAMAPALARHDALLRAAIVEHGGHVVKTMGDAFHAVFRDARDAVAAALDGQRRLQAEPWDDLDSDLGGLRVRMALHTGVTETRDGDYYGPPMNRVARLLSIGHGGQILLSEVTAALTRDDLPPLAMLADLGTHRLKDLTLPERVFLLASPDIIAVDRPLVSLDARPHNLPLQTTPLLGRDQAVRAVTSLLLRDDVRLITLTGPGGSGKTRLSLQVAADLLDRFEDGVFFVELAPISDPSLVVSTIAQTLSVEAARGRPLLDVLMDFVRGRRLLLVLDNFEQVLAAATVIDSLLRACPSLRVLVTSRAALQLRGEREYPVPPLALPDMTRPIMSEALSQYGAVALFVERATAIKPDFAVTNANAPAVAEICARLDGLPLAIELAAARIRLLSPEAMLPRLGHGLGLLAGGRRDLPPRQQTLRGAIAWSYDLLPAAQRRLFRHLSVFVGGFTLDAAEAIRDSDGDPGPDVFDGVTALVDSNLVRSEELLVGEPRFWMLETIREYGLEQLAAAGEETTVRRRHLAWCVDLAEVCQPELVRPHGPERLDRLASELDNFRAALAWSLADPTATSAGAGLRLATALLMLWFFRDRMAEGQRWLEQTLAANDDRGEPLAPLSPLPAYQPGAHGAHPRVNALNVLATMHLGQETTNEAAIPSTEALALARVVGDRVGEGHALHQLGLVARRLGELTRAETLVDEALSIARSLDDAFLMWRSLNQLGLTLTMLGDYDRARQHLEESLAVARSMGHTWGAAHTLRALGMLAFREGKLDRATALFGESLPLLERIRDPHATRLSLWQLGGIAVSAHDPRQASARFADSLRLSCEASAHREIPRCLDGMVAAAMTAGLSGVRATRAARLIGASALLREAHGVAVTGDEQAMFDRAVAAARAALGEHAYDAAVTEGRSLSLDRTTELALALASEVQDAGT